MAFVKFEGKQYPLLAEETVLSALLRGGASVPSSCRRGSCQTCLMRLAGGRVKQGPGSRLHPALSATGHFLPCVATSAQDLEVERPHLTQLEQRVRVTDKRTFKGGTVQLFLMPEAALSWRAGQRIEVSSPWGDYGRYCIASCFPAERRLEFHIDPKSRGSMDVWLCRDVNIGQILWVRPPQGKFHYDRSLKQRPLLLVGMGTGLAALLGVARTAQRDGHEAGIYLYHGAPRMEQLYGREILTDADAATGFEFFECVSHEPATGEGVLEGAASACAFKSHPELSGYAVFIAGEPDMVDATRVEAVRRGASRHLLFCLPFDSDFQSPATERATLMKSLEPELELWQALGHGEHLRVLLERFYAKAYGDALLAPLLKKLDREQLVTQQCAFLGAAFTGAQGLLAKDESEAEWSLAYPFGAKSLIVSDELFDHRESLFEECLREYGLPEPLIRRWCAFNEQFRREAVTPSKQALNLSASEQYL